MSDDAGVMAVRQSPRTHTEHAVIADFTLLVRVPNKPTATRVFTDSEADDAAQYAAEAGGEVVPLPPSRPPR